MLLGVLNNGANWDAVYCYVALASFVVHPSTELASLERDGVCCMLKTMCLWKVQEEAMDHLSAVALTTEIIS